MSQQPDETTVEEMQRFYTLAKRQAWKVEQLSWGQLPPIPEKQASQEKAARRREIWVSVVTQQLQADMLASQAAVQLLTGAPDMAGKLYYSTMMQDEARHAEAWLKLTQEVGGTGEPDPYLEKLGKLTLESDSIEEKVWLLQVIYEGLVIDRFHQIAAAAPGTILGEICKRLAIDDGIHHGAGVAYEQFLLQQASPHTKRAIERVSQEVWPLFLEHLMWRPRARSWINTTMSARDMKMIQESIVQAQKLAAKIGLDIGTPPIY